MMRGCFGCSSRGASKRVEAIDLVGLFTEQRGWRRQSLETWHSGHAAFAIWIGPSIGGVSGGFRTNQGAFRS